jgi:phosphoglycerol transferase MdoB-like AlkP superfamily enzyme
MRALDPNDVTRETIPTRLARMGYDTVSLHGFIPNFFGRDEWYPLFGFKRSFFVDDLDKLLPVHKRCGSAMFQGICDDEIPSFVAKILSTPDAQERPKFIYWLTLNSHYPFGAPPSSSFRCDKNQLTLKYQDICNLSATIYNVLSALARLAADPDTPPTRFIITADHSPPFLMRKKDGLFDKKYVPFIELIPRESKKKL